MVSIDKDGYILIWNPRHPFSQQKGYVPIHRLVYETINKCCLLQTTIIHHINGDKQDNRIENLEPMNQSKHATLTHTENYDYRICYICGSNKTHGKTRETQNWYKHKEYKEFICGGCYKRLYR